MHLTYFKPIQLQKEALITTCTRALTILLTSHFTSSHFATFSSLTLAHYLHSPHHTVHYLHIEAHSHLLLHFSYLHSPNSTRLIFIDVGIGRWWRVWLVVDHVAPLVAIHQGRLIHVGECEVGDVSRCLWTDFSGK